MNKTKAIRTAVVGLGRIAWQFHLPKIAEKPEFELAAVVEPLQDRVDRAAKEYNVRGFADYRQMLEQVKPDLVVVASPTPFHKQHAIDALEAGCDVFCEKPATLNFSEFEQLFEVIKRTKRKFMVYQPHRALAETVALKDILKRNIIGDVYMMRRNWFEYGRRNDWQAIRKYGGGMLNNYGAHFIDQLLYLSDYKADTIQCITRNIVSPGDAEDFAKITIETESKTILDVEINLASAHKLAEWQILGEYGSIIMDETAKAWEIKYCLPEQIEKLEIQQTLAAEDMAYRNGKPIDWKVEKVIFDDYKPIDYYHRCFQYFSQDIEPFVPIEQTYEIMRVLQACADASESN